MSKTSLCFCYLIWQMHKIEQNNIVWIWKRMLLTQCYIVILPECQYLNLCFSFNVFACYLFGACQSFIITSYSTDLKKIFSYLLYTSLLDFFKRFKNSGTLRSCHQVAIFITPFLFVFNWCHFLLYDSKSFKTILPFFHAFILIENSISKTLFLF